MKVAAIFEIPTPYRHPVFEMIIQQKQIQVDFFFLNQHQKDRLWNIKSFSTLPAVYLKAWQICFPGYHTIHMNQQVNELILKKSYDVFVIGGYAQPALIQVLWHVWRNNIPYVMVTESHFQKKRNRIWQWIKDPYVKKVYHSSGANLVMSSLAKEYVTYYGANPSNVYLFPNTVDGPAYSSQVNEKRKHKAQIKKSLGIWGNPVILYMGTLNYRKGVDVLLHAFSHLRRILPEINLVFVGNGSLKSKLQQQASQEDMGHCVHFFDFVQPQDLPQYYALADIFVLPSRQEPFGAVVCEALAGGLPTIVSSAVGAAKDFIVPGSNGFITEANDVHELVLRIQELAQDAAKREAFSRQAMAVMQSWTHQRLADHFTQAVKGAVE